MRTARCIGTAGSGRVLGGREPREVEPAFCRYNVPGEAGGTLIAVPHAGREYPADIVSMARVDLCGLRMLEDRHADALAERAVAAGQCAIIARRGRALLDLNRHVADIDHASVIDLPHDAPMRTSAKLRGGLGLLPQRHHGLGDLWHRRPTYAEVTERVAAIHAPYHGRIADLLADIHARRGNAVLIDLHSMPAIKMPAGRPGVDVVIGDRFGQSAAPYVTERVVALVAAHGLRVVVNRPYPGGYTLERHGRPERDVHAVQIEIDRSLYLDDLLDAPGPGADSISLVVANVARGIDDLMSEMLPIAAE